MTDSTSLLDRFTFFERVVHWVVGLTFVFLLLTGLAFSHPSLYWLTVLVGGGPAARVLHPWVGVVFGTGMFLMLIVWLRPMILDGQDWRWLFSIRHYAARRRDRVPPADKYNAGQKMFFWAQVVLAVAHVVTGVFLWIPESFSASLLLASRVVHYTATVGGGLLLVLHVYLATIAFPGTARTMIDGKATKSWARHHHPRWYAKHSSPEGPS